MSRVHCLECADQVVVDPRGLCPEGHEVGTVGSRIEQAMGHQAAHPDEPQPWVYRIDPDELEPAAGRRSVHGLLGSTNGAVGHGANGAGTNGSSPTREARPVRVPGLPEEGFDEEPADAESLLRELHSLAALDSTLTDERRNGATNGQHRRAPVGPTPGPGSPPPPPPEVAATTPRPPRPPRADPSEIADAFAELNALDVPRPATNGVRPASPTAPPASTATPAPSAEVAEAAADELSSLFDDPPLFTRTDPDGGAGASAAPAIDPEAVESPPARSSDLGRRDRDAEPDDTAGLELEAMFELAEPTAAGPAPSSEVPAVGSSAPDVPPPAQGPTHPEATEQPGPEPAEQPDDEAAAPTPVPTPAGPGLDLSSFTAKGGAGSGKANRRRRFGR